MPEMNRIELGKRSTMLFDGDCGICTYFADLVMRMDQKHLFWVYPYQSYTEDALTPLGITYADCARKLQAISNRGRVYRGAFAVNYFLYQYFPWRLVILLVYLLPPLLLLEILGYWLVARNRTRLSRWLGMKACLEKP